MPVAPGIASQKRVAGDSGVRSNIEVRQGRPALTTGVRPFRETTLPRRSYWRVPFQVPVQDPPLNVPVNDRRSAASVALNV